ncbi:MAG: sulfotransferase, partial [Algiphilus sp.]
SAMRLLVRLMDGLAAVGVLRPALDPDRLVARARRRTGLEDLGEGFDETGLRLLLEGCQEDAHLHALGALAARQDVLTMLCNRLRMVDERRRWPEIAEQRIQAPLFITGLPRSGTTFLHRLLAQDPQHRSPAAWELLYPSPPPRIETATTDRRIAKARRSIGWLHLLAPAFRHIHEVGPTLPEECIAAMGHCFVSERFPAMYRIPRYERWFDALSLDAAYADHRRMLQHLQWRHPAPHWLLKAPAHLFGLDAIFNTYPDAHIIQTHRDPARSLASWASFVTTLHGAFSHRVDPMEIGNNVSARWQHALERALQARAQRPGGGFIDVHYDALVADPMGTVRAIYRQLERPLSAEAEAAMQHFLRDESKEQAGRHHYAAGDFGLDPARERQRFAFYIHRFGVSEEPVPQRSRIGAVGTGRRRAA